MVCYNTYSCFTRLNCNLFYTNACKNTIDKWRKLSWRKILQQKIIRQYVGRYKILQKTCFNL